MIKKYIPILFFLAFSCGKDEASIETQTIIRVPVLNSLPVSSIQVNSAMIEGRLADDGGNIPTVAGVVYSTEPNPTLENANRKFSDYSVDALMEYQITDLERSTKYYFRVYATNSAGTGYGNELSFTTLATEVLLRTKGVTNITSNTADINASITDDGGANITERGICWNTSENPTIEDSKTIIGEGLGEFQGTLSDLKPNTRYYAKSYAINMNGPTYGNEIVFVTEAGPVSIATSQISNITGKSAVSGGALSNDGGSEILAKGVCWNTSINPTIDDSRSQNGSGSENFESILTNLKPNTQYFVRAYATNISGTFYGEQISFLTGDTAGNIYDGDLTISTQEEVESFGALGYNEINGSLFIGDGSVTDVSNLDALAGLTNVGSHLIIYKNDNLGNLDGLSRLETVGGDLKLNLNNKIVQLDGFSNVVFIGGNLEIQDNDGLTSIEGLANLTALGGSVFVQGNYALTSLRGFPELTEINGELNISGNNSLQNLNGLETLKIIKGNITIGNQLDLTNIDGIANIVSIKGDFGITGTGLTGIDVMANIQEIRGVLSIKDNPQLARINGFQNITDSGGIIIKKNIALETASSFKNISDLKGDLVLADNTALSNFDKLERLIRIQGDFTLINCMIPSLQFIENVETIEGNLELRNVFPIFPFQVNGLENLRSIGSSLIIDNIPIYHFASLNSLEDIGKDLIVENNLFLRDITFKKLNVVGGDVLIQNNDSNYFWLDPGSGPWSLKSIGGNLIIQHNNHTQDGDGFEDLDAFQNLISLMGNLVVEDNKTLSDFCGLKPLLSEGTLNGTIKINNNAYNPTGQSIINGNCSN